MRGARAASDQFDRCLVKRIGNVRHSVTDSNGSTAPDLANHVASLCLTPSVPNPAEIKLARC